MSKLWHYKKNYLIILIMKIFVVDDEPSIRLTLKIALQKESFEVVQCTNGQDAIEKLDIEKPNLIILDFDMPIMNGFEFLDIIRKHKYNIPVILLSDYADVEKKVEGLTLGADDYLGKPFSTKELIARIKVLLRRYDFTNDKNSIPSNSTENANNTLLSKNLELDLLSYTLKVDGIPVDITVTEFRLLQGFLENPNQVLSREQLMDLAYPEDNYSNDRSIDCHIKRLRKKIGNDYIETIYGAGYKMSV